MLVSIITPVHNGESTLAASAAASLAQDHAALELIIVDDASGDRTREVIAQIAGRDSRVKSIAQPARRGVSAARNRGLDAAAGDYIAFVDADDELSPDFCFRLLRLAESTGAGIAKGVYAYGAGTGRSEEINARIREDKNRFCCQFCSALYRADVVAGLRFEEGLSHSEDNLFAQRAALAAERIACDNEAAVRINLRKGSATLGALDQGALDSHFRSLGAILGLLGERARSRETFNHNLALLSGIILEIASQSRALRPVARSRAEEFFASLSGAPFFDAETFARFAPPVVAAELPRLLAGDSGGLFHTYDQRRLGLCRNLLRKPA